MDGQLAGVGNGSESDSWNRLGSLGRDRAYE
jgi:hypothetical protein